MTELKAGQVILYPYRRAREAAQDRSPDGAKERPCCLVVRAVNTAGETVLFLAAISSKPPLESQSALEVPDTERRRAGLGRYARAFIYVDEINKDVLERSWYLRPQEPLGEFGKAFLAEVAKAISANVRGRKIVGRGES